MAPVAADTRELAEELLAATRDRAPTAPLTDRHPSLTVEDAYAIQREVTAARLAAGSRRVGRKIGLTSRAMQTQLGVDEPDYGQLFNDMDVPDGGVVWVDRLIAPRVEPEIALVLATDLRGPGVTPEDVLAAAESICGALEIIDSRIADWRIRLADTVADNASSGAFVLGRPHPPEAADWAAVGVRLRVDGSVEAEGRGDAVLGHPANAVAWLANALSGYGEHLSAGEIVLPGSMCASLPLLPGIRVEAEFDFLGTVSVEAKGA